MKSRKPQPGSTSAAARIKPRLDLTRSGTVYCLMMLFMLLAAINSQANLLFGVFGMMLGVLVISFFIGRNVLRKLEIRRRLPSTATVGQPLTAAYELTNRKCFWPSLSIGITELDGIEALGAPLQAYMLHAAPRTTAVVPAEAIARRRGAYRLDRFQVVTAFPFGFLSRAAVRHAPETLLVLPALGEVAPRLLELCRSATLEVGSDVRPRAGGADEFYGLKEYRPGENTRWIYWRKTARTGRLVLREMTQVSPPRLLLMVDTFLPQRSPAAHAAVERTIAMAASLASRALESDLQVGAIAWAEGWKNVLPGRGKQHRRELLSFFARLPLNQEQDGDALLARGRMMGEPATSYVLLTPRDIPDGISHRRRSGLLAIGTVSRQAQEWFHFEPSVDFESCMPPDQQPDSHAVTVATPAGPAPAAAPLFAGTGA